MTSLTLLELEAAACGRVQSADPLPIDVYVRPVGRVVTDSRQVHKGDVFWALVGENCNGAEFAAEAYQRGAAGVVASHKACDVPAGCWLLLVDEPLEALWRLASTIRDRFRGTVIAVTGSVGKTTTRQMIDTVLGRYQAGSASPKNYNNHVGLPLAMLQMDWRHDYVVLELGASSPGEISRLASLARPHVGVITSIGEAHLGGFGSIECLAQSKAELLEFLPQDGRAVLVSEDKWQQRVAGRSKAPVVWVGRTAAADISASWISSRDGWLRFYVGQETCHIPVWGRHHLIPALSSVAVGRIVGLTDRQISEALLHYEPPAMRCQVYQHAGCTVINDAYNASPRAMQAGLELLRDLNHHGKKIAICGDMRELGAASDDYHRSLGEQVVALCGADHLISCGDYAEEVVASAQAAGMPAHKTHACRSVAGVRPILKLWLSPGDAVLLKGSRSLRMETVFENEDCLSDPTAQAAPAGKCHPSPQPESTSLRIA